MGLLEIMTELVKANTAANTAARPPQPQPKLVQPNTQRFTGDGAVWTWQLPNTGTDIDVGYHQHENCFTLSINLSRNTFTHNDYTTLVAQLTAINNWCNQQRQLMAAQPTAAPNA